MPFRDITNEFKRTVKEHEGTGAPDAKRRKVAKLSKAEEEQITLNKNYVAEAYNILNHIRTLTRMLASVRTAYLNVDARSGPVSRSGSGFSSSSRTFDLTGGAGSGGSVSGGGVGGAGDAAAQWSNVKYLTNEERDQIDLQARVILTRCADRVKEMEALEKRRADLIASKSNPLTRLLPARLRQDEGTLSSDVVAAHHSGITWYLSRRLAEASQTQKELQEERVRRQLERTKSLGAGAAQEAMLMATGAVGSSSGGGSGSGSWGGGAGRHRKEMSVAGGSSSGGGGGPGGSPSRGPGGWLESTIAATIGATAPSSSSTSHDARKVPAYSPAVSLPSPSLSDDDDDELELSASQILQFEQENANILKTVQDTLESVQQAESRLLDISALQMELVTHLTRQTELTDQLYEDAIMTTSTVEKGNEQLKEAKRRAKDSRLFLLVFLIGASLSLLFLHYY